MSKLLINRMNLRFNEDVRCFLNISNATGFSLVGNKVVWTKKKLPLENLPQFETWLYGQGITEQDFVCFDFSEIEKDDCFSIKLNTTNILPFKFKIFLCTVIA